AAVVAWSGRRVLSGQADSLPDPPEGFSDGWPSAIWVWTMMPPAMSLLARMDRLPFSRPHYALLVIGGLGYAFDGADNALVAFRLPSMAREWGLDNGALGLLAAAGPLGYLVGALVAGTLGDRVGR